MMRKAILRYGMEVAMLANTTGAASVIVRTEIGMGAAFCGFRRDILETSVLTLQIKFGHSLNS